ncbi:hypothetical protein MJO28_017451 [Puccinia striiformis f. sp. tritici]|nr:hypothetical protein MJO28_017451 [Puccinia striiformis f. sp. tritici]
MSVLTKRQEKVDYDTAKLSTFLKNGTSVRIITTTDAHILRGWSYNTLLGYNCGIKKYLSWKNVTGVQDFTLPMTNSDLEGFCLWAGKKHRMINSHNVNAKTIRKFFKWIQGVARLPWENLPSKKPPIMLNHMVWLANNLVTGSDRDKAILDLAIVAFWGMARMAEITYYVSEGPLDPESSVLTSDVASLAMGIGTNMYLTVRNAKTATCCDSGRAQGVKVTTW